MMLRGKQGLAGWPRSFCRPLIPPLPVIFIYFSIFPYFINESLDRNVYQLLCEIGVPWWPRGLRIQQCHSWGSGLIPGLGPSARCRHSQIYICGGVYKLKQKFLELVFILLLEYNLMFSVLFHSISFHF